MTIDHEPCGINEQPAPQPRPLAYKRACRHIDIGCRSSALPLLLVPGVMAVCIAAIAVRAGEPAMVPNEPGEENPGGNATTQDSIDTREAFSHFSHGIGFEGEAKFKVGNAIFRKLWISAPSSTTSSDGLGPLYNSRSCQSCHLKDGRGHPPGGELPRRHCGIDVPAAVHPAAERRAEAPARRASRQHASTSRPTASSCRTSPCRASTTKATCTSTTRKCR